VRRAASWACPSGRPTQGQRARSPAPFVQPAAPHVANVSELSIPISQLTSLVGMVNNMVTEASRLQDQQRVQLQLLGDKQERVFQTVVDLVAAHLPHHDARAAAAGPVARGAFL